MKVINIKGSQGPYYRKLGLGDWMHRKRVSRTPTCSVYGCGKIADDGAHVIKTNSSDHQWYIMPTCHAHNMSTDVMELKSDWLTRLIPLSDF